MPDFSLAPASYLCYDVSAETPHHVTETPTTIDQLGTRTITVDMTRDYCNPVEKRRDGRPAEPIVRPDDHLACIRIVSHTPAFTQRDVFARDQFGLFTLPVELPRRLCVPSTLSP